MFCCHSNVSYAISFYLILGSSSNLCKLSTCTISSFAICMSVSNDGWQAFVHHLILYCKVTVFMPKNEKYAMKMKYKCLFLTESLLFPQ